MDIKPVAHRHWLPESQEWEYFDNASCSECEALYSDKIEIPEYAFGELDVSLINSRTKREIIDVIERATHAKFLEQYGQYISNNVAYNSSWQPINAAPLDGSDVILCEAGISGSYTGYFDAENEAWYMTGLHHTDSYANVMYPTHWMKMPLAIEKHPNE